MPTSHWEHFEHAADIGVRGIGPTAARAFEQAALAMLAVITDPELIAPRDKYTIDCDAPDLELLLYEWLNQLIYLITTQHVLFARFEVNLHDHQLSATIWGEPLDRNRHQPAVEVKGATFTELKVQQLDNGNWLAQTVVDV